MNTTRQPDDCDDVNEAEAFEAKRNRYFSDKAMTAWNFRLEQHYLVERRRLLSRAIAGWGIAYGFELSLAEGHLSCGRGLALDRAGRELQRAVAGRILIDDILRPGQILREAEEKARREGRELVFDCLLTIHYAERHVDPVRVKSDCDCDETRADHVCETVAFCLEPAHEGHAELGEPPCLACRCSSEPGAHHEGHASHRQRLACLCQWQAEREMPAHPEALEHCGDLHVALKAPVALARVSIAFDKEGRFQIRSIDARSPRRLIKTNEMLHDLIRGCDLTRIEHLSWGEWHRRPEHEPVPWEEFRAMFPERPHRGAEPIEDDDDRVQNLDTNFVIKFSGPVQSSTLHPDCIAFTVYLPDELAQMEHGRRVRVAELKHHKREEGDPEGTTRAASLMFDARWLDNQIWDNTSQFRRHHTRFEIEIRGDYILDCHGQAIDGQAIGRHAAPSGNGSPGGSNLTTFRVAPHHHLESD